MEIVIRNYLAGSLLLEEEPNAWDAIVIFDSDLSPSDFVAQYARRHIYLRFDDVIDATSGKRLPTSDDILAALEFSEQSEKLMVCCRAGQSRSAAVAFVIGCHGLGSETAGRILNAKRHRPNSLIVELGARLIDDPFVLQAFAKWQLANEHIKLSSYVDEIEREFDQLERKGARNRIVKA
jgi:hypothetical protein